MDRYSNLVNDLTDAGIKCDTVFVEVGSRGFITKENKSSLTFLARKLRITKVKNFIAMTGRTALEGSRIIYNARNSPSW